MTSERGTSAPVSLAEAIQTIAGPPPGVTAPATPGALPCSDRSPLGIGEASRARLARAIFRARRDRDASFGDLGVQFGEPCWDIMLDLYRAHYERHAVSISSACIAASVPATTGLRHLVLLERRGLVERRYDPLDRRRCFVNLTNLGLSMMDAWVSRVAGDDPSGTLPR